MRNTILLTILVMLTGFIWPMQSDAGEMHVYDTETIRMMIVQPDVDMSIFVGEELCTALIDIIDNYDGDYRDRYVKAALGWFRVTEDERSVEYLIEYLDEYTMNCLHGLGHFSTVASFNALKGYLDDEDEFNRRFAVESLGKLDYTVSDEMWELRDGCIALLNDRLETEGEEWILPIIEEGIGAVESQVREEENQALGN